MEKSAVKSNINFTYTLLTLVIQYFNTSSTYRLLYFIRRSFIYGLLDFKCNITLQVLLTYNLIWQCKIVLQIVCTAYLI